jgi:hypothetical protein
VLRSSLINSFYIKTYKGEIMKNTILIILITVFSFSILFMSTGCNTEELEELTKKIEETSAEKQTLEKNLADAEGEAQDLQKKIDQLDQEISSLNEAKNLIAFIVGEDGAPLSRAIVTLDETGEEAIVGDNGTVSWMDLAGDTATLSMDAQGYFPKQESVNLHEGTNGALISMERDPFGLLPSEVCIGGETFLYLEDFQDGMAQGWAEIETKQGGWSVEADPEEEGNIILVASEPTGVQARLSDEGGSLLAFDNAVWRIRTKYTGSGSLSLFLWKLNLENSDINYGIMFGKQTGIGNPLDISKPSQDEWHIIEISTFNGVIEMWVDGKIIASYDETDPLPAGLIGLAFHGDETAGMFYYDDISVCELNAPFKSILGTE